MEFMPTAEKLIPDLSEREELVLLARTLWREGYNDHLAGHITCALVTARCCATRGSSRGTSCVPSRSSASTWRATSSRAIGRCRSASRCTCSCTSCAPT